MPPFKYRLTREDAESILDFFKSRWGKEEGEYQWWMTITDTRAVTVRHFTYPRTRENTLSTRC